ncbi:MAG: hypothetical protein K9N40_09025, partial [Candidatus Cloacimonetes bacterium]|nr:hypothetical protein [Candidatus Cloacimonadota bacterium]
MKIRFSACWNKFSEIHLGSATMIVKFKNFLDSYEKNEQPQTFNNSLLFVLLVAKLIFSPWEYPGKSCGSY